jgi:hypothetical protein
MKSPAGYASKHRKITFCDLSGIGIPFPDPRYLALHASFARTFFQSGVERYLWELEAKSLRGLVDASSSIDFGDEEEEEGTKNRSRTKKRRKRARAGTTRPGSKASSSLR